MAESGTEVVQPRVTLVRDQEDRVVTVSLWEEDHTLGNALRHVIAHRPGVEFVGYTIPHPSEPRLNLRVQSMEGFSAVELLVSGLESLGRFTSTVREEFGKQVAEFSGDRGAVAAQRIGSEMVVDTKSKPETLS